MLKRKEIWQYSTLLEAKSKIRLNNNNNNNNSNNDERERENLPTSGLCRADGPQSENQRKKTKKKKKQLLRPCQRTKKRYGS